jgi:hypothetical protein
VPTVLVSKLEGPVTYPLEERLLSGVHAGSTYESFRNPDPDVPPEINVAVDRVAPLETGVGGLRRQPIYDYAGSGLVRRLLQWRLRPKTVLANAGLGECDETPGDARAIEDRADEHEHRQREQRVLGDRGVHVLRRREQAPPG